MEFDEELKNSSVEEKLKAVDKKLNELYKKCPKKKRLETVGPILSMSKSVWWKKNQKHFMWPPILVALVAVYVMVEPDYFLARVVMKKSMMTLLPNFDYNSYYEGECIINNPFLKIEPARVPPGECKMCQNATVETVEAIKKKSFSNDLLEARTMVITDAISKWEKNIISVDDFNFGQFVKLHLTLPEFKKLTSFCTPFIKVPGDKTITTVPQLFQYILKNWKKDALHFSAAWVNCNKQGYNAIRNYYDKAYFLPEMTEVTRYQNSVLISSRVVAKDEKPIWAKLNVNEVDEASWVAAIYNNMQIRLVPKPECAKMCKPLKLTLKKGQILNLVNRFYSIYFRAEQHQSVGIAVGYRFNS